MLLRALALCLLLPLPVLAEVLPKPLSDTVSDYDNVLTAEAKANVTARLAAIRADTGVHMVVVVMDRLAAHGGGNMSIETYAETLFNAWGVGDRKRDDGMLLLVVTGDRVVRFALGSGYDAVYDGRAQRLIDTVILPEFAAGRIDAGIVAGVTMARDQLIAPFLKGQPVTMDEGLPDPATGSSLWLLGVPAIAGLLFHRRRRARIAEKTCPNCHAVSLAITNEVLKAPTSASTGNGLRHATCSVCGHASRETYSISRSSSRSGSSGGFGGGSSSGGGATGRW